MQDNYARVTFLGATGVGKTSILMKIVDDVFDLDSKSTIMVDFRKYEFMYDQQLIKLTLWDTAGQETYRSITNQYLRGSKFFILVCAIDNPKSLEELNYFVELIREKGDPDTTSFLLCNKCDLEDSKHLIPFEDVERFAAGKRIHELYNVSAKTGYNLNELLNAIAQEIIRTQNSKYKNDVISSCDIKDDCNEKKNCC